MFRNVCLFFLVGILSTAIIWWAGFGNDSLALPFNNALLRPSIDTSKKIGMRSTQHSSYENVAEHLESSASATTYTVKVERGSTAYKTLEHAGLSARMILHIVEAAKPLFDLANLTPGTRISISRSTKDSAVDKVEFAISLTKTLRISKEELGGWRAQVHNAEVSLETARFSGIVRSTLWASAVEAGMDPKLINNLAKIFAWQIDFNREVRLGDRWRLSIDQQFVRGVPIGWGVIRAAQYQNAGVVFSGIRYENPGATRPYYTVAGHSLRRLFLKSPIRFGRITSRFSPKRFHPILKINKPHLGVDYGAPRGTPVLAVGRGLVEYLGRRGGSGKTIRLRHNSVFQTAYKHLSRYAKGLRRGDQVEMGQVIGYVGSTGLATGPHLHFEFYENGRVVDPLGIEFPSADPIPQHLLGDYKKRSERAILDLPDWVAKDQIAKK